MTLESVDALVAKVDGRRVSGAELAPRTGTSRAWISRILSGERNLTAAVMGKLAFALGTRVTTHVATPDTVAAHTDRGGSGPR